MNDLLKELMKGEVQMKVGDARLGAVDNLMAKGYVNKGQAFGRGYVISITAQGREFVNQLTLLDNLPKENPAKNNETRNTARSIKWEAVQVVVEILAAIISAIGLISLLQR